jgi:hypothetical protein
MASDRLARAFVIATKFLLLAVLPFLAFGYGAVLIGILKNDIWFRTVHILRAWRYFVPSSLVVIESLRSEAMAIHLHA